MHRFNRTLKWIDTEAPMIYYTCRRALLPAVEAVLAANGYAREAPLARELHGARITVMTRGAAVVLLAERAQNELATVEVLGHASATATNLLDHLPLGFVQRQGATS